jgi:hypothetical protein
VSRGDRVIEISTGNQYIIYDSTDDEICILQFFDYAVFPFKRQLHIWQSKDRFTIRKDQTE